ncbi:Os05g0469900 [Oryza sativa Japonica Group]|uniref:Os05g0469900 protein n=2 Tax=Oryza sativa subsp. japonica TaxID=39947 RepID=A0A5S6RBA2_ORYSJ|nr:unknown protein [Oryza sativa Japonica Group]BAF17720.2 Os05g0469900 [Oryza sativa Japonica Group]BAG98862.1 unnamed protein product [Oryza sativa Japonica Group]|eukprot:NP_001055806.2 Os05g0469900 [Oryza sativa Japonica Group]
MESHHLWPPWEFIWKSSAPPRVKFFGWLMTMNRLPTAVNLHKKSTIPSLTCQLCNTCPEDTDHIFLAYPLASAFWGLIQVLPMLTSLSEIHTIHWSGDLPERLNSTFFLLCCWRLWNHRNEVVFQLLAPSINRLLRCCANDAKL